LIWPVSPIKVGAPFFAFFAKGGSRECGRKFVDPSRIVSNQIAHAASQPARATCAKDGAPRLRIFRINNEPRPPAN
jgi:hypothetical protein